MLGIQLKLVKDWRDAWSWLSVQFALAIAAWPFLPEDDQTAVVTWLTKGLGIDVPATTVLAILVIVGRVVEQRRKAAATPPQGE